MGSNDEPLIQHGLIFEVKPVATNEEIERVERECELLGQGPGLGHANGVGRLRRPVWHGHHYLRNTDS